MASGSGSGYKGLAMATASKLMAEVTREYELCMSSLVFDSNMMNEANIQARTMAASRLFFHVVFSSLSSSPATFNVGL